MRHITVTVYDYSELTTESKNWARSELRKDWDGDVADMTEAEVEAYCEEHGFEFTYDGNVW